MEARPFQIEDAKRPGTFLGATGWTQHRPSALSFIGAAAADIWLEDVRRNQPRMMIDREPRVVIAPEAQPDPPVHPPVKTDWDPFSPEAA